MTIRDIAVFHRTARCGSAWCCVKGISVALAAMGYQVMNCGCPKLGTRPI